MLAAAKARSEQPGAGQVHIFKNNTDFHGSSYGTHENYLIPRETPFAHLLSGLLPFFATRIIYTGAGKLGIEPRGDAGLYQLSQRADFFSEEASVDTLHRRPLVNTRDEPHTDPRDWRRLHVICGDANMSEYATALKIGTTYLVTSLLEQGWQPWVRLKQPTEAIKTISRDQSYKVAGRGRDGDHRGRRHPARLPRRRQRQAWWAGGGHGLDPARMGADAGCPRSRPAFARGPAGLGRQARPASRVCGV